MPMRYPFPILNLNKNHRNKILLNKYVNTTIEFKKLVRIDFHDFTQKNTSII